MIDLHDSTFMRSAFRDPKAAWPYPCFKFLLFFLSEGNFGCLKAPASSSLTALKSGGYLTTVITFGVGSQESRSQNALEWAELCGKWAFLAAKVP